MAIKQKVKFRVIKQSSEVGGKYYGVINNADPFVPSVTMQQIIDYKKLHNYSASQLAALIEDVLQGAAELVGRDGLPRNLSSLLKFEARIRGTFTNSEAAVTDQKVYVAPRLLKDIKVDLDKSQFEFTNENDTTAPTIASAALEYAQFAGWSASGDFVENASIEATVFKGPLVLAGSRLAPNGWTADCGLSVEVFRAGQYLCNLDNRSFTISSQTVRYGFIMKPASVASVNALKFSIASSSTEVEPYGGGWKDENGTVTPVQYTPLVDDELRFTFSRILTDGSGTVVTATKRVTLLP